MQLDGQFANERFTQEYDEPVYCPGCNYPPEICECFPQEEESAAPEELVSAPELAPQDFEEDGDAYDKFYPPQY